MSHRPNKQCPIPYCGLKTTNERILFDHYKSEHMVNAFACADCFKQFDKIADLSSHFDEFHLSFGEFRFISTEVKCNSKNYPGYEVLSKEKVLTSRKPTESDDTFQCFLCPGSFQVVEVFQAHCVTSHNGKFVTCSRCQTPFGSIMRLIEHSKNCQMITAQNPLDAVPFFRKDKCLLCKAVNLNESEVLQHYMEMHLHTKYVCDICQSHFPSDAKLKEHTELRHSLVNSMKTRAATEAKIQENFNKKLCAIDMQHFETINEIRDHFLFAHKEYKLFQCDECDECYLNSRLLKDHQKLHSDENGSKKQPASVGKKSRTEAASKEQAESSETVERIARCKKRTKSIVRENVSCNNSKKMRIQSPLSAEHHGVVDRNKSSIQTSLQKAEATPKRGLKSSEHRDDRKSNGNRNETENFDSLIENETVSLHQHQQHQKPLINIDTRIEINKAGKPVKHLDPSEPTKSFKSQFPSKTSSSNECRTSKRLSHGENTAKCVCVSHQSSVKNEAARKIARSAGHIRFQFPKMSHKSSKSKEHKSHERMPHQSTRATNMTKINKNNGQASSGSSGVSTRSKSSKTKHFDKHASPKSESKKRFKLLELVALRPQRTETETSSEKCQSIFETNITNPVRTETETSLTENHTNAEMNATAPAHTVLNGWPEKEKLLELLQMLEDEPSAMSSTEPAASEIRPENENSLPPNIQKRNVPFVNHDHTYEGNQNRFVGTRNSSAIAEITNRDLPKDIHENGNDSATKVASASSEPSTGDINVSTEKLKENGFPPTTSPSSCETAADMPEANIKLERDFDANIGGCVIGKSPQPTRTPPSPSDIVDLTLDSDDSDDSVDSLDSLVMKIHGEKFHHRIYYSRQ